MVRSAQGIVQHMARITGKNLFWGVGSLTLKTAVAQKCSGAMEIQMYDGPNNNLTFYTQGMSDGEQMTGVESEPCNDC